MAMRITQGATNRSYLKNLNNSQINLNKSMEKLQTGRKFSRVSDDVSAASKTMDLRARIYRNEKNMSNVEAAVEEMHMGETVLTEMKDIASDVPAEMLKAMNTHTLESGKETFLAFLDQSKQEVLRLANEKYNNKYLLGGLGVDKEPFTADSNGYLRIRGSLISGLEDKTEYNPCSECYEVINGFKSGNDYKLANESETNYVIKVLSPKKIAEIDKEYDKKVQEADGDPDEINRLNLEREDKKKKYNIDSDSIYYIKGDRTDFIKVESHTHNDYNQTQEHYYFYNGSKIDYTHNNYVDVGLDMSSKNINSSSRFNISVDGIMAMGYGRTVTDDGEVISNNIYDMMTEMQKAIEDSDIDRLGKLVDNFKKQTENLVSSVAEVGIRSKFLETTLSRLENENSGLAEAKNYLEATEDASEITKYKGYQNSWDLVLQFGRNIIPKSLMDYVN
ncbi:MAG: hypothetical protein PUE12_16030 [Oscillospiraceae bacterium]|nr:hypothetical protein [Oscillospiraceae bacterium]